MPPTQPPWALRVPCGRLLDNEPHPAHVHTTSRRSNVWCVGIPVPIRIRKNGTRLWPWQVSCSEHPEERIYISGQAGVVAINSHGIGNATWRLALYAAELHIEEQHS